MKSSEVASGIIRRLLFKSRGIRLSDMLSVIISIPLSGRHKHSLSIYLLSVPLPHCFAFSYSHSSWSPDRQSIDYLTSDQYRGEIIGLYIYNITNQTGIFVFDLEDGMNSKAWSPDCNAKTYVNID